MRDEEKQDLQIKQMKEKEAEELARILSEKYKIPYLDLSRITIELDALSLVEEPEAREAKLAVFQRTAKKIQVAILSPNPEATGRLLQRLKNEGYTVNVYLVSEVSLERAWRKYSEVMEYKEATRGIVAVSSEKIEEVLSGAKTFEDLKATILKTTDGGKGKRVTDVLEIILAGGIGQGASDIHIEPQEERIRLRFRLDGVLHDILFFPTTIYNLLLSRIKLVSGLKLNVHEGAQDGRFSIRLKDTEIEVRASVIPEAYGESIVLRILNPESIGVSFEDLGIEPRVREALLREIKRPNGMVLTTGPTGSGKTTTLYAFLKKIYSPDIKIITLEDPIEYHITGITQTQVNKEKGYSFAEGLRSILRQDPDVIMVGEIRDLETAKIAINAALTGHFVLSTLHTNNAAGAIPRLIDLGENPAAMAPAINAVIAQRLVRTLCSCKTEARADDKERKIINNVLASLPEAYKKEIKFREGMALWRPNGCEKCNMLGYKGRIGIYELIVIDEPMKRLIIKSPDETEIQRASKNQGFLDMRQDGVIKVLNGVTTLEELSRVVDL